MSPEAGEQKVRAWGPGLETGQVGKSADFVVEAVGTEVGTLGKLWQQVGVLASEVLQGEWRIDRGWPGGWGEMGCGSKKGACW